MGYKAGAFIGAAQRGASTQSGGRGATHTQYTHDRGLFLGFGFGASQRGQVWKPETVGGRRLTSIHLL